jgi:hypothetical protein
MIIYYNYICTVRIVYILLRICCEFVAKCAVYCRLITGCAVCCKLITGYAVYCKLITKCTVCRNLLADIANLLQNARFIRFAKDHIRPPQSYGSPQTAANRNNQPQKKIPDVGVQTQFLFNSVQAYKLPIKFL